MSGEATLKPGPVDDLDSKDPIAADGGESSSWLITAASVYEGVADDIHPRPHTS